MTTGKPFASFEGWSSLQRPVYSPGLLLEDDDLNVGVSYTQGVMRLMLKSLFGCGVICGLDVTVTPSCEDTKRKIVVNPGIALDGEGNLIEVPKSWTYEFGPDCDDGWPGSLWVVLCYKEKCCRPKDVSCSPDGDGQSAQTRARAGYEINVWQRLPKCACHCGAGDDDGEQEDGGNGCCGHKTTRVAKTAKAAATVVEEELCACYTDHFHGVCGCGCCRCVVLAKIVNPETIVTTDEESENPGERIVEVDSSMVRRVRPVLNGYLQCRFPEQERTTVTGSEGTEKESKRVKTTKKADKR